MVNAPLIPDNAPFSPEQRAWLNGFIAALLQNGGSPAAAAPAGAPSVPLLVAFGSQSGNSEALAKRLVKQATAKGFAARAAGLEALKPADVTTVQNLLLVTSTWGEGDVPDNAVEFWEALNQNGSSPRFDGLRYGVIALGDRNYGDTFCLAGRRFDERFAELGAQRVLDRVECDVDYEAPAADWSGKFFTALAGSGTAVAIAHAPAVEEEEERATGYDRKHPFPAALLQNNPLTGPGSGKDTRHIVLSLAGSGLTYETGDALGVYVRNCPGVVDEVITAHGLKPDETCPLPDGGEAPLREALLTAYEVRSLAGRVPEKATTMQDFAASLRRLQPRLYSIASSLKAHPDEVHLTVGVVQYEEGGRVHKGVASTFLAQRLPAGDVTGVFIQTAKHFRLPADGGAPVIMVGPGTGIAPFRAFLEEREATGAKGDNWLFFGDRKSDTDFLYREQLESWKTGGHLTRLDLAFSRDTAQKVYVQDRMRENAVELWSWLQRGAYFYVCGDAKHMAKDVDATLREIIAGQGGLAAEAADAYVAEMKKAGRYARDVY
jgi:sulfite reductase (NADPH) flavoprotein alpha-component